MLYHFLMTALFVFGYMLIFYTIAQKIKNNAIVDIAWSAGFVLVAIFNLFLASAIAPRQVIVTILVTIWGLRLSGHIWWRSRGKPEDFRYAQMRKNWGEKVAWRSLTRIFLLQGAILLSIAYPLMMLNVFPGPALSWIDFAGITLWTIGFLFEAIGDYQLLRFIRNEKSATNRFLTRGLWKFTRHPNYFGEALLWWGIFLLVLPVSNGILAIFSPLIINFLLIKISGIPMLEKKFMQLPEYRKYAAKTNKFIPWFPKTG